MIFSDKVPGLVVRAVKVVCWLLGGELVPDLRCIECGHILNIDPDMPDQDIQERVEAHRRFFHPD